MANACRGVSSRAGGGKAPSTPVTWARCSWLPFHARKVTGWYLDNCLAFRSTNPTLLWMGVGREHTLQWRHTVFGSFERSCSLWLSVQRAARANQRATSVIPNPCRVASNFKRATVRSSFYYNNVTITRFVASVGSPKMMSCAEHVGYVQTYDRYLKARWRVFFFSLAPLSLSLSFFLSPFFRSFCDLSF